MDFALVFILGLVIGGIIGRWTKGRRTTASPAPMVSVPYRDPGIEAFAYGKAKPPAER